MAQISNFTSKGTRSPGTVRSGVKVASLGREIDGKIYQHPRVKLNPLEGASVRITNPAASNSARNKRTASLGMGGVGWRGRNRDFS